MEHLELTIDGMTCGHCVAAVRGAMTALPGVQAAEVRIGFAAVDYDADAVTAARIAEAVADEGYGATFTGRSR
jgi:copper chaperone